MFDLPKWATDALTQLPAVIAVFVAIGLTVRWMDKKAQEMVATLEKHAEERLTLLKQKYTTQLRAKDLRIRELERALAEKEDKGKKKGKE